MSPLRRPHIHITVRQQISPLLYHLCKQKSIRTQCWLLFQFLTIVSNYRFRGHNRLLPLFLRWSTPLARRPSWRSMWSCFPAEEKVLANLLAPQRPSTLVKPCCESSVSWGSDHYARPQPWLSRFWPRTTLGGRENKSDWVWPVWEDVSLFWRKEAALYVK